MKEFMDLGTLGKPKFKEFDPDLGMARVLVRSSNAENMPQQVVKVDGKHDDPSA